MFVFIQFYVLYITPFIFYFHVTCHVCGLTQNSLLIQRLIFARVQKEEHELRLVPSCNISPVTCNRLTQSGCGFCSPPVVSQRRCNGGLWLSGCECLLFSATYGKEYGSFSSPDYPHPYQDNINCLLYTFIASRDEIIQITFKDFDVQKSHLE